MRPASGGSSPWNRISRTAGVLAAAAGSIAAPAGHSARAAEPPVPTGPPVIVTDTRIDESAARTLPGARVITAQEIARTGAATMNELLRSLPELRTRELPGTPNLQLDLRGFGLFGDQNTLVLLDGQRVREYEQLTVNWSATPLASVARIEILPPGSAVIHGGGTTAGAINIVTAPPPPGARSAYLGAGAGSHRTREARAGGAMAGDALGLRMHGSHYDTDNHRDNNRTRIDSGQAEARWTAEPLSLMLRAAADDQYLGVPGVLTEAQIAANRRHTARPHDFATQRGSRLQLAGHTELAIGNLSIDLGYRERDTTSSFLVGTPLRNNVANEVAVWTLSPRWRLASQHGRRAHHLIVGSDVEDWRFDAISQPAIVARPHSTQRSAALYAHYAFAPGPDTLLSLGARRQRVRYDVTDLANPTATGARSHTLHAWNVAVRQSLTAALSAQVMTGRSFRLPNVADNFNPFLARVTLLAPQTASDAEFRLEGSAGALRYRAAVYRVDLRNEIFFDPVTLGSRNRLPTRREALTLEARGLAAPHLELHAAYTRARARFREGVVAGRAVAGNRVPLAPRHMLDAGARWRLRDGVHAELHVRHVGRSPFDADETNTFGREVPAYTVADLGLRLRTGGWLLNGSVRNLFDGKYFSYGVVAGPTYAAFPAPGRTLFVSAQYALP